jgi:hypothetical protein
MTMTETQETTMYSVHRLSKDALVRFPDGRERGEIVDTLVEDVGLNEASLHAFAADIIWWDPENECWQYDESHQWGARTSIVPLDEDGDEMWFEDEPQIENGDWDEPEWEKVTDHLDVREYAVMVAPEGDSANDMYKSLWGRGIAVVAVLRCTDESDEKAIEAWISKSVTEHDATWVARTDLVGDEVYRVRRNADGQIAREEERISS